MPLSLKTVEPARGARWVSDAWRLFVRRPMTFCAALAAWLLGGMLLSALLPVVGSVLMLMSPPLFSLGFMIAGQSVLLDGPVRPRQFVEPLLGDKARRNALLVLCLLYAALVTLVTVLVMHIADAPLSKLMQQEAGKALPREEVLQLLGSPEMSTASIVFVLAMSAISAPFWHAPALVHWGAQSAPQALFSSLLAVWRSKLAFAVYFAVLTTAALLGFFLLSLLASTLLPVLMTVAVLAGAWVVLGAVFYLSVLFTFNDSFGGASVVTDDDPQTQPDL